MAKHAAAYVLAALCLLLVLAATDAEATQTHQPLVPAMFVFGDSTVDVGNNNNLRRSIAKANFRPYGIDFPRSTPTGRFSNGFNTADLLAQLLGFPMSPPAYLSLTGGTLRSQMYKGINFASGGSGLADETGRLLFGQVIPMSLQLDYFASVVEHMTKQSGSRRTASLLCKSIFFISTGSNDMFQYSISRSAPGNDYAFLRGFVAAYKSYITALYKLGARKFSLVSVPALGCIPSQRLRRLNETGTQGCYDPLNDLSLRSYPMLAAMLQELAHELPGMSYSLGDSFAMVSFVFTNPRTKDWNFKVLVAACCGGGPFGAAYPCDKSAPLCGDRDEYLFWDANHPTQAASAIAAQTLFAGDRTFVNPINVKELALL
ncbi:hypothetical protein PR202_ga02257 [Eleusine coracana subsp. coracana]|uniref:GDSL esterase/lipase n=1 Tax=Eleusine coracana subsp. coracana TaxID=191504 RepID=A0AAV5BL81_ELECO|nr:hypothetical protein QOZ80_2AG0140340 [Eleusine coracana subsp. coracana]GJM86403.1 hypothetical protein PR202_ga02257 [Eleusine coracana subsp. coracana]